MVHERDDVVGMDGSILMNRAVWKASGHEETFSDPMVDCLTTGKRFRADQIEPQQGWIVSFAGAVDFDSLTRLLKEQSVPERSTIWSRVDLAPQLRKLVADYSDRLDEKLRAGYFQLRGRIEEQIEALTALIRQR